MTLYTADDYILARLGWHDAICPEGEDCRDRNIHALSAGGACPLEAILDAVLPAYRKRLLNDLADKIEDSPFPPVPASYMRTDWLAGYEKADALTVDMLRAKAREVEL